jgi:hypothetical protein
VVVAGVAVKRIEKIAGPPYGQGAGAHGAAQLPHGGCRIESLADAVAYDQSDAAWFVEPECVIPGAEVRATLGRRAALIPTGAVRSRTDARPPSASSRPL